MNKFYTLENILEIAKYPENISNELLQLAIKFSTTKLYDPEAFHYIKHYWRIFRNIRNEPLKILEIGVKRGESLLLWREFFPRASIYGVEINPEPLQNFNYDRIEKIFYGDQENVEFLKSVSEEIKDVDIIIDDGGHTMLQQKTSFQTLFPLLLKIGGLYIIEDMGTSYWQDWGGGLKRENTAIEYMKELIDGLNYRAYKGKRDAYVGIPKYDQIYDLSYFDENVESIEFIRYLCFIRKGNNFSV